MSRDFKERPIEDLQAGNAFRDTLVPRADGDRRGAPIWHGWAIMDAFLAGLDHRAARIEQLEAALATAAIFIEGTPIANAVVVPEGRPVHGGHPSLIDTINAVLANSSLTTEKK